VDVSWDDLERLVGVELSEQQLESLLFSLKCEISELSREKIEYEIERDRPDLFSAEGLARAIKGLLEVEVGLPKFNVKPSEVKLYVSGPVYRPYCLGAVVKNLEFDNEALRQVMNLQEKLHVTYCRNRRKVSIGLYDLAKVKPPIRYEAVKPEEVEFVPLDHYEKMNLREVLSKTEKGREYAHLVEGAEYPILVDEQGTVLSFPPIINSEDTAVTEETKAVFIDVTGTDLKAMTEVLKIVVTSVAERGGEKHEIGIVKVFMQGKAAESPKLSPESLKLPPSYVHDVLGEPLSEEEIETCLLKMRHGVERDSDAFAVRVAPYRIDVLHPVDLVEDVAMAYGYARIKPELLPAYAPGSVSPIEAYSNVVRDVMVGLGFQEVANYIMCNKETLTAKVRMPEARIIEVVNPKSERYNAVRSWLVPVLMEVLSANKRLGLPLKVFEVGDVVVVDENLDVKARTERHLACAIASKEATITNALVALKAFMRAMGLGHSLRESEHPAFIPGRFAEVLVGGEVVGLAGEVHPEVLLNFELSYPVSAFELNLTKLLEMERKGLSPSKA